MQLVNSVREMSQRMNLLLGVPYMEWWLDEYHRGATIVSAFGPAYLRAVSGHRVAGAMPYCITHGNPYDQTSFPMHELYAEAMIALTNGIQCPMFSGWYEALFENRVFTREVTPGPAMTMSDPGLPLEPNHVFLIMGFGRSRGGIKLYSGIVFSLER